MAADDIDVRLHLREIRVLEVVADTRFELRVKVESTVRHPLCAACGIRCSRVHDTREHEISDVEIWGRPVTLLWRRRRFDCDNCGTRWIEDHPEFDGRMTRRLAKLSGGY